MIQVKIFDGRALKSTESGDYTISLVFKELPDNKTNCAARAYGVYTDGMALHIMHSLAKLVHQMADELSSNAVPILTWENLMQVFISGLMEREDKSEEEGATE